MQTVVPDNATVTRIFVPAMDCPDEEREIRAALGRLPGVLELTFHLFSRQVEVRHAGDLDAILDTLRKIGMEGHPVDESIRRADIPEATRDTLRTFLLSAALMAAAGILHLLLPSSPAGRAFLAAAVLAGGLPVLRRGLREVRNRSLGMNALMSISISGATIMGEWAETGAVVTLFALANYLEARSLDRARRATTELFASSPERAVLMDGDVERNVAAEEVVPGDLLIVRPGERIPVDAAVRSGASDVNESILTGESAPVAKAQGDMLYAGTVNGRGLLLADAVRPLSESTYARILRHVEEAQAMKAPIQTFMERFASWYTPGILAAAILTAALPPLLGHGAFQDWAYRALVLLVIACPCAIVLAAPVATVSALTRATREGILMKGTHFLETLGKVRAVAFDKTGTLTHGRLRIVRVRAAKGTDEARVLRLAAAVESGSAHPAAEAVRHEMRRRGMQAAAQDDLARTFEVHEGRGVSAEVDGERVHVGNRRLFEELGVSREAIDALLGGDAEGPSRTVAIVGTGNGATGILEMEDTLREEAPAVVGALERLGVEHVVMLTGDRGDIARDMARAAGIGEVLPELLPEDKMARVRELVGKYGTVAMVGDGVNDAPALALSTVGIAMGAAGSPAAIETADVALMTEDLRRIPAAIALGRRMVGIVRQNVVASLAIKLGFLVLAVAGYATLWMAVIADMGTTLLVVFNGLRLLRKTAAPRGAEG